MMWFKKHLWAIFVVAFAVTVTFSAVFTAVMFSGMAKESARSSLQQYNETAGEHTIITEDASENDYAVIEDCQKNSATEAKKIKPIKLPSDLLKNAVWSVDTSSNRNSNSPEQLGPLHADFSYDNKAGIVYYVRGGLDSPNYGVVEYDNKRILTSVAVERYDDKSKYDIMRITDVLDSIICGIPDYEQRYIDKEIIVADPASDNAPKTITNQEGNQKVTLIDVNFPDAFNFDLATTMTLNSKPVTLFSDINTGYYAILANGRVAKYASSLSPANSTIIIDGKSTSLSKYDAYRAGGCGSKTFNIIRVEMNDLKEIGNASNGEKLYAYKDNEKIRPYYETIYYPDPETNEKISFEKFLAEQPYFIWFDGFGSAIEYRATKFTPAAECGKPVIYLYPEKDMNVSVKVEPNGGFKLTEPAYNNGWNVWATTKSELTNISDGTSYPYLFWEGKAYNYDTPDHGFVLKRENVARDMAILLKRLGLNEKESADFMEFWQPKLEIKPFVYVTFVSQEVFDKMAPLTVSPQPDKVIRVFMDYEPLDKYVSVPPLKISSPTRTGFTVVEWGGRLR